MRKTLFQFITKVFSKLTSNEQTEENVGTGEKMLCHIQFYDSYGNQDLTTGTVYHKPSVEEAIRMIRKDKLSYLGEERLSNIQIISIDCYTKDDFTLEE